MYYGKGSGMQEAKIVVTDNATPALENAAKPAKKRGRPPRPVYIVEQIMPPAHHTYEKAAWFDFVRELNDLADKGYRLKNRLAEGVYLFEDAGREARREGGV